MLMHQHFTSEGSVSAAIQMLNRTVTKSSEAAPVQSGIVFNATGVLDEVQAAGNQQPIAGQWLLTGSSALFWIQRTIVSGTLQTDPGTGWLQMNVNRSYVNINSAVGDKETEVTFEISTSAGGSPVVATASMQFTSQVVIPSEA